MDNPLFFRDFARRCRELIPTARTDVARRQLAMWAEEFEQRAKIADNQFAAEPSNRRRRYEIARERESRSLSAISGARAP